LAPALHKALRAGEEAIRHGIDQVDEVERLMHRMAEGVEIDYLVMVDPETFRPPADFHRDLLLAGAARLGRTRLIDNVLPPMSAPFAPCTSFPSTGGWKMRTQVPLSEAPVTIPSKRSPMRDDSRTAAADLRT